MNVTRLKPDLIRRDGDTQPREVLNFEAIDDYSAAMLAGQKFPPVDVYYDGTDYWLADGFHRVMAALEGDVPEISATIHQGTREDAQWHSFAANKGHGLRRSNEDKARAVKAALVHARSQSLGDREIARHCGVSVPTVSGWREKLGLSVKILQIHTRTVTRNGTTYQQNVSNIGKRSASSLVAQPEVQLARNEKDAGSNPAGGSNTPFAAFPQYDCSEFFNGLSLLASRNWDTEVIADRCEDGHHVQLEKVYECIGRIILQTKRVNRATLAQV